jgi:hypothetical protein
MNDITLITVYCFVDEFIKIIMNHSIGHMVLAYWEGKRGPKKRLSLAEVMTLNILRFYLRVHDLKTFHRLLQNTYREYFPTLPNYENFLKASNRSFPDVTKDLEGLFVGDAGYILREEAFQELYERHRHIISATRKNIKRVMSGEQKQLFRDRSRIEMIWGVLKERFQLVYHLARGTGLFRHYFYSIISFLLRPFYRIFRFSFENTVTCLKLEFRPNRIIIIT